MYSKIYISKDLSYGLSVGLLIVNMIEFKEEHLFLFQVRKIFEDFV